MTTTDKTKLIENILRVTKKAGQAKYFDSLHDREEAYLKKTLQVCKNLRKLSSAL